MIYIYYLALLLFLIFFSFQIMYLFMSYRLSKVDLTVRNDLPEKRMSILVPAYNEEAVLRSCLDGFALLNYDNYELIIVNDGSTDTTMSLLKHLLKLKEIPLESFGRLPYETVLATYVSLDYPHIKVIDKINGGKADSLNAGADYSSGEIIITLDADSILNEHALTHVNEEMQNSKVLAGGGMVHVGQMFKNGRPVFGRNGLIRYQLSDYMLSFYIRRLVQSHLGVVSVVSGAFGAFRSYALFEAGGYKKTVGEDMEVTLNFQRLIKTRYKGYKLSFIPKAQCYTEVPADFKNLSKQRVRWQKGFLDSLRMYDRNKFSKLGPKFVLFLLFDSILPGIVGIFTTFLLVYSIAAQNLVGLTLVLLGMSAFLQIALRLSSYRIPIRYGHFYSKRDYLKVFFFSIIELPTYRLLDSFYFMYGTLAFLFQKNHSWNKVQRSGVLTAETMNTKMLVSETDTPNEPPIDLNHKEKSATHTS